MGSTKQNLQGQPKLLKIIKSTKQNENLPKKMCSEDRKNYDLIFIKSILIHLPRPSSVYGQAQ
jgi:hypothetical protein